MPSLYSAFSRHFQGLTSELRKLNTTTTMALSAKEDEVQVRCWAPRRQLNGQACTSLTTAMQLLRDELAAARREHAAHMQKLRVKFAQEVYIARKTQRQLQLV